MYVDALHSCRLAAVPLLWSVGHASAAEADAFLMSFVQGRVGTSGEQAASILVEFRAWRQRRAELPEDHEGRTG